MFLGCAAIYGAFAELLQYLPVSNKDKPRTPSAERPTPQFPDSYFTLRLRVSKSAPPARIPGHLLLQLNRLLQAPSASPYPPSRCPHLQAPARPPPTAPCCGGAALAVSRCAAREGWGRWAPGEPAPGGAGGAAGAGAVTAPCVSRCVMTSATPAPRTAARGGALPPAPAPPRLRRALRRRWTRLGRQDLLDRQLPGAAGHRLAATCEAPRLPPLHRPSERSLGASAAPRAGPSGRGAGSGAAHGGPGARLSRRSHPRRQRGVPGRPGTPSPRGPSCAPRRAAAAGPSRPPAADREGRVAGGASARVGATA